MLLHDRLHHGSWKGWDGLDDDERAEYRAAAAAVLADLTERGRILPDPGEAETVTQDGHGVEGVGVRPITGGERLRPWVTHQRVVTAWTLTDGSMLSRTGRWEAIPRG